MRTLKAWGSWRSEDLGGAETKFENRRRLNSIVCILMIEDLSGVRILEPNKAQMVREPYMSPSDVSFPTAPT